MLNYELRLVKFRDTLGLHSYWFNIVVNTYFEFLINAGYDNILEHRQV